MPLWAGRVSPWRRRVPNMAGVLVGCCDLHVGVAPFKLCSVCRSASSSSFLRNAAGFDVGVFLVGFVSCLSGVSGPGGFPLCGLFVCVCLGGLSLFGIFAACDV